MSFFDPSIVAYPQIPPCWVLVTEEEKKNTEFIFQACKVCGSSLRHNLYGVGRVREGTRRYFCGVCYSEYEPLPNAKGWQLASGAMRERFE